MSMKKDMFLYLNMNDRLLGLNLREFSERYSSKPEFEVVQVLNYPNRRRPGTNSDIAKKDCMTVCNSNLYMMRVTENHRACGNFDLDVYSFDPTGADDSKSIRLCDKSASPRLMYSNRPIVFTLDEKIYVLGVPTYLYSTRSDDVAEEPQLFWVFDPFHESWKPLPHPLFYNHGPCNVYYDVSYGHKLFIRTYNQRHVFDAHQERWEGSQRRGVYDELYFEFNAIVEFGEGFLIAVPNMMSNEQMRHELVAYKLDVNGIPQPHQVLHELTGMFSWRPLLINPRVFLGKFDDNVMWLVYCGKDNVQKFSCIGVAVFRVSMSYDNAGKVVFLVDIEAADFIDSNSYEVQGAKETTLVYSASAMCHDNVKTKDWFLYLNMGDRLCSINISEFCKRKSSFISKFGVVHDFYPECRPCTIPSRIRHITVGSNVYLVGGQRLDGRIHSDAHGRCYAKPNLDIYAFNHNYETEDQGPSITLCQCEGSIPRLIDPRTKTIPITIALEDKIYVLAKRPYLGDAEELNDDDRPLLFKVFDPLKQSWKHLPHPPCYNISSRDTEPYVCNYFSWGHKLIIRTEAKKKKENPGTYIFDTHQEKWEDAKNISAILNEGFRIVAEFQGFLIGMPYKRQELVAYHLDSNGIPKLSKVLHELQEIFSSCLLVSDCFLGKYDGDRMWLVYSAQDSMQFWHARVAMFRVFISNDFDGNQVLCADLEAAQFFHFDRFISSAFTYHGPNSRRCYTSIKRYLALVYLSPTVFLVNMMVIVCGWWILHRIVCNFGMRV